MSRRISFFKVSNRKIEKINDVNYAGTNEVDKFHFFFEDAEWNDLNKTLEVFIEDEMQGFPIVNDEADVGRTVYKPGIIYIRIHGIDGTRDLKTLKFPIPISAADCDDSDPANTPTESEWNAFITEINAKLAQAVITKEECEAILEQVLAYRDIVSDDKDDVEQLKTDVQGLKTDVEGLKGTIEQEITDAEAVLDTYNANYEQKLAAFNENYAEKKGIIDGEVSDFTSDYNTKLANFNSNAETKTTDFNSNAASKKSDYDSNASAKKTDFNDNASSKKSDYNTNATNKTNSFNTNYDTKLAAINTAGSTQKTAVETAGTTQVGNVNTAGSTQVGVVETAGTTQVGNVNTAGTTQTNAVNAAGQAKLDEINSNQTVQQVANHESRLRVLEKKDGRAYSIVRKITSNSSPAWTRADDAVGLVANAKVATTEAVQNDFDNIYPWSDIKDCNVDANGDPTHFLGESGFTRNDEVYVYIPKHWIHREQYEVEEDNTTNKYEKITIYDYAAEGSIEIAPYMVGKYRTSNDNGTHVSKKGLEPLNNTTKATFRTKARAKGTRWSLLDWHIFDLQYLYLVEYANYNVETIIGAGHINSDIVTSLLDENSANRVVASSCPTGIYVGKTISIGTDRGNYSIARSRTVTAINDYDDGTITGKEIVFDGEAVDITTSSKLWGSPQITGELDDFGNSSGCLVNDQRHGAVYRGLDLWGTLHQHIDGYNIKDGVGYLSTDYTAYANDKFDGTYSAMGYTNSTTNDSYIKEMGFDTTCASDSIKTLVGTPTVVGGSSTTYVCDNYWYSAGDRILYVGGNAFTGGSKCGLFASYCNHNSSTSHWNYGARLLIQPE